MLTRMGTDHARRRIWPRTADQITAGDNLELSDGEPIQCMPTAGRGGSAQAFGAIATLNDPMVESGGVEVGFSPKPEMLRAPDVAIGGVTGSATWEKGVPSLAIEYADLGQDEADLKRKIAELLREGTKLVWVVRLVGPLRVEVHEPGQPVRIAMPGDELEAPGILANAVPVAALFDKDEARRADLNNLLQRFGYGSVEKIRAEGEAKGKAEGEAKGKAEGRAEAVLRVLQARGLTATAEQRERILGCADAAALDRWIDRAVSCSSIEDVFG
jgi:Uma2 family endonuclease